MNQKEIYLLGIETSGLTSAVGISYNDKLLGKTSLNIKNIHSRRLALLAKQIMENSNISFKDLSGIAISAGPGSFTGLRIGYSLAKGLAHSLKIPMIEVPTLDIWAFQGGKTELPVLSIIDAHRDEIFCAQYLWKKNRCEKTGDYQLSPITSLKQILQAKILLVGPDLPGLKNRIVKMAGGMAVFNLPLRTEPDCQILLQLAYQRYLKGEVSSVENCEPMYMRAFKGIM